MYSIYVRSLIAFVTLVTFSCQSPAPKESPIPVPAHSDTAHKRETTALATTLPLGFLRSMDGKSFQSEHLFSHEVIATRLRKLMGEERFGFMRDTWAVESGMVVNNDTLSAEGCMQHNCGATNFIIVVDIIRDKIYAGICEEGKIKTWGEDSVPMLQILKWRSFESD